jgi:hypothetical protein
MKRAWIGMVVGMGLAIGAWLGFGSTAMPVTEDPVERFLATHWTQPLPPQGGPAAERSALEASLDATACAQCHAEQWDAWSGSLHSRAMGPGIEWQLRLMDQEQGNRCLRCHAPLAEQKALVALERGWSAAPERPRPDYVPGDLHRQGVACAVCHVRGQRRFGPPASPGKGEATAHGGFVADGAFEDSRFCATCHQFPADGPRLAGKLHEDTLAQWQASGFAGKQSCQQCHMPERRHLFRGIHDPEMVRRAVEVQLDAGVENGRGLARVAVVNVGAGHHFPTYMVPKVHVRLALRGPQGQTEAIGEEVIGWQVDVDITREQFDTRIPAGGRFEFERTFELPDEAGWSIEVSLAVAPREHYERVFAASLEKASRMDAATVGLLRAALREARQTRFEAMRISRPLQHPGALAALAPAKGCKPHATC